ncbi:MAG TPA: HK97 family phage prohead protease [Sphingomicrobium sp.]|nr:HK97 family phage prohead protease [Sphingomicrobium sp.]
MTTPATSPKTDCRETRATTGSLELRAAGDASELGTAAGYAALFGVETDIGGWWREKIAPGAFAKSLRESDVVALHSHNTGRVVGRMKAGTLSLREDDKGLAFENALPDTSDGRDLNVQIERGDIAGMSFGFITRKQEWDETVDPPLRTILEAELFEITYTAFPAYPDTSVGLRDLENIRNERRQHNKTGASTRIAARRARQAQIERGI